MSRGRRMFRLKPVTVDGWKFISENDARRYESLKSWAGDHLTATKSTDGRMLVCEYGEANKQIQTFALAGKGKNKFNAKKTEVDGIRFDSGHEARRYVFLKGRLSAGEIADLRFQVPYEFTVNGQRIGKFTADFVYIDVTTGKTVTEDAKSTATRTEAYQLRKRLMRACHSIEVAEV